MPFGAGHVVLVCRKPDVELITKDLMFSSGLCFAQLAIDVGVPEVFAYATGDVSPTVENTSA